MRRSFFQNLIRVNWMTIERLDKLILKVSNIFFFFFFNVFSFDGKPRLIHHPRISFQRETTVFAFANIKDIVVSSNRTEQRIE